MPISSGVVGSKLMNLPVGTTSKYQLVPPFLCYFRHFLTCIGIFRIILVNNTKKKKGHQYLVFLTKAKFWKRVSKKKRSSKIKILKPLWIVQKSTLVAKFHNNFPILPQKDPENPLKMEISIENYHLVSKFPVLTGNSWVGGSSFSEIPVSRHMFTNLHKWPPPWLLCYIFRPC